jgi:anti-sigma regulatory factor (Ser/Thr protein kinase)
MSGLVVELPSELSSPGEARRALGAELVGHGISLDRPEVESAMLVISELVTNAIVHGSSPIRMIVDIDDHRSLNLAVTDTGNDIPQIDCHPPVGQVGGWGMELVERVSLSWGVLPAPDDAAGKIVWAHLEL